MVMLKDAVSRWQCDGAFLQKAQANNLQDGTTACTVLISGTDLFCANVGDSEAAIVQMIAGAPKAKKIAQIHKPEQKAEADRIRQLGGEVLPPTSFSPSVLPRRRLVYRACQLLGCV